MKKKKVDDEEIRRVPMPPVESKPVPVVEPVDDRQSRGNQPLPISPVASTFRTQGDQKVPVVESKKEPGKTVKWSEQLQTFQEVTFRSIVESASSSRSFRAKHRLKWTRCCLPWQKPVPSRLLRTRVAVTQAVNSNKSFVLIR